ncbi:hypothetical protein MMC08_003003 [Hypocenomyce scalaris]|nr:hypothetical protein [Hypocenomyce scalaris]
MGCENLVIARTDSESGKLLSSAIDVRDHEYILGVTEDVEPLAETLQAMELEGASGAEIDKYEADWVKKHQLVTFDEAVVKHLESEGADKSKIDEYTERIKKDRNLPLSRRRTLAAQYTKFPVSFSWDIPRTREGFYHYQAGLQAATKRAIEFAPYADLLWLETADPSIKKAGGFAGDIRAKYPGKQLVYNLSPSFNWMGQGFDETSLKSFIWDLAKHGFVLQLISLAGLHSTAMVTNQLSKEFKTDGMSAYVKLIQRREKELGVDVLTHQKWSGAGYIDGILGAIQSGSSGSKSMGEGNTESDPLAYLDTPASAKTTPEIVVMLATVGVSPHLGWVPIFQRALFSTPTPLPQLLDLTSSTWSTSRSLTQISAIMSTTSMDSQETLTDRASEPLAHDPKTTHAQARPHNPPPPDIAPRIPTHQPRDRTLAETLAHFADPANLAPVLAEPNEMYCICRGDDDGTEMVECSNGEDELWFCQRCQERKLGLLAENRPYGSGAKGSEIVKKPSESSPKLSNFVSKPVDSVKEPSESTIKLQEFITQPSVVFSSKDPFFSYMKIMPPKQPRLAINSSIRPQISSLPTPSPNAMPLSAPLPTSNRRAVSAAHRLVNHPSLTNLTRSHSRSPSTLPPLPITIGGGQGTAWKPEEQAAVLSIMKELIKEDNNRVLTTEKRWDEISKRLAERYGFCLRTAAGVKNHWNRVGRAASGIDERQHKRPNMMTTGLQKGRNKRVKKQGNVGVAAGDEDDTIDDGMKDGDNETIERVMGDGDSVRPCTPVMVGKTGLKRAFSESLQ